MVRCGIGHMATEVFSAGIIFMSARMNGGEILPGYIDNKVSFRNRYIMVRHNGS